MSAADEARELLEEWLAAVNASDLDRIATCFHMPHIALRTPTRDVESGEIVSGTDLVVWTDRATVEGAVRAGDEALRSEGCHHTSVDSIEVVQESSDKVHFAVVFARERRDGTVYKRVEELWIATWQDGGWGCKLRSVMPEGSA